MSLNTIISRRRFIQSAAASTSFIFLPGLGRVKAKPFVLDSSSDYEGRLCLNENPLGPSQKAQKAMNIAATMAHRYPDWVSEELETKIAEHHGLKQTNICAGVGASEILRLCADAFLSPGTELISPNITFRLIVGEASANGANVVHVPLDENNVIDLDAILKAINLKTKLISIVNPNNPTGTIINKTDLEAFLKAIPNGVVVLLDEAYHHYVNSPEYESCIRFVEDGLPVIVARTFSKAYGLAGARIGYSIASPKYTELISSLQQGVAVSRLAQAAAKAVLEDTEHVKNTIELNNKAKSLLEKGFSDMGLKFIKSETNFMICDVGIDTEQIVKRLSSKGYCVRGVFGMPQHIRVSTGLIQEMEGFLETLKEVLFSDSGVHDTTLTAFALYSVSPNPFKTRCEIKISTTGQEKVKLPIYNKMGQLVCSLIDSSLKPGIHKAIWDGKDFSGTKVDPGIYTIILMQGEFATSAKVELAS